MGTSVTNSCACRMEEKKRTQDIVRMYCDTPSFLCFKICYLYLWSISTMSALACCCLSFLSFSYFSQYFNFSSFYHLLLLSYLTHIALTFYFKLTNEHERQKTHSNLILNNNTAILLFFFLESCMALLRALQNDMY